jgi:serine/threonine protein kinase
MKKLHHPNLVQLLFQITKEKPMAIGLEYLTGGDFATWLQREGTRARGEDIFYVLFQVASGMAELERLGIGMWRGVAICAPVFSLSHG